ncbi:MAG: nitrilase family protein [Tannerellaceae bacterium]|jgi:predicted amidohydrolase|nr:nitrilase family protein [Tannerellaceae bacterium]
MADNLHITGIQAPVSWEDRQDNLARFGHLVRRVSGQTNLVVLPEMFTTGCSMNVETQADTMDGITLATIRTWARECHTALTGSFLARDNNRYYNRAFFITPSGESFYYDKRHLFTPAGEHLRFTPGARRPWVNYLGWNICLQVCYDLRFPVWSRNVNKAYDLLIYMANWPETRIRAWHTLLPARAIENQAYVCAVNRTGNDRGEYRGHSAIYSPLGEKLSEAGNEAEVIFGNLLDKHSLEDLRRRFPVWQDADPFTLE